MMSRKFSALLTGAAAAAFTFSCAIAVASATATSPAAGAYKAPLNSYGQPDLEGTWTNASLTVLERPKEYGAHYNLSEDEVKKVEGAEAKFAADGNAPTDP